MLFVTLFFASALVPALAAPDAYKTLIRHEERSVAPSSFVHKGSVPENTTLNLRIALMQGDIPGLEKALYDVSDPSSPLYGEHLSKDEASPFPC
jgi:tripeptidyl-peptidase-1